MSKYLILAPLSIVLTLILTACTLTYVKGSGNIVSESRNVSGFTRISLDGSGQVYVTQGETEGLKVETDDNLMSCIKTEVRGDTLYLSYKHKSLEVIRPSQPVRFYVNIRDVAGLEIDGSGRIESEQVQADTLKLAVNGSGRIELSQVDAQAVETYVDGSGNLNINKLAADSIFTSISGAGKIVIAGQVQEQSIEIDGSGNYLAQDLASSQACVQIDGSGNVELAVAESLKIDIDGSGRVVYKGQPAITQSVSGSGKVIHRETN